MPNGMGTLFQMCKIREKNPNKGRTGAFLVIVGNRGGGNCSVSTQEAVSERRNNNVGYMGANKQIW